MESRSVSSGAEVGESELRCNRLGASDPSVVGASRCFLRMTHVGMSGVVEPIRSMRQSAAVNPGAKSSSTAGTTSQARHHRGSP